MTRYELHRRARFLSTVRKSRHGMPPAPDPGGALWWAQIEELQREFNLPITWDEWHSIDREPVQEALPL